MSFTTYSGSCHCGKIQYKVRMAPPEEAASCNCSICSKAGWLLAFSPATMFELSSGEAELTDYQFNTHRSHHFFCKTCGIRSFSRGKGKDDQEWVAINLRCIADIDVTKLPIRSFDGAAL